MLYTKIEMVDLIKKERVIMELFNDVTHLIENSEYSISRLKGVGNLSRSDLDSVHLYIRQLITNGGCGFSPLMEPMGSVRELLEAYKIL